MSETITATTEVQSVTLTKDEVWECVGLAPALVADDAEPALLKDWTRLNRNTGSIGYASGKTIYYRSARSAPTEIHRAGVSK